MSFPLVQGSFDGNDLSPRQILLDLEEDRDGGDDSRQFYMLDEETQAAIRAGGFDKAAEYAHELLREAAKNADDPNYGNAIYDGNMALGRVALRQGCYQGREAAVEAGRTPGSTQLNSFCPDMTVARELLEEGEREVVLQYFALCRRFWAGGSQQPDAWSKTVREGGTRNSERICYSISRLVSARRAAPMPTGGVALPASR